MMGESKPKLFHVEDDRDLVRAGPAIPAAVFMETKVDTEAAAEVKTAMVKSHADDEELLATIKEAVHSSRYAV